jgi:hypothetical protein
MTLKPELIATLQSAANAIETVTGKLDRTTSQCGHCDATRWNNRDEYQTGLELDAVIQKLRKLVQRERAKIKANQ